MVGSLPGSTVMEYNGAIREHGGIPAVAKDIIGLFRPEISALQDKEVSTEALEAIRRQQNQDRLWIDPKGYLDFVTDRRDPEYMPKQ
jgi:hypothetical protein